MARPAALDPDTHPAPAELVDLSGIAAVLGVKRVTVDTWRNRGRQGIAFPPPDKFRGRRPWWRWSTIAAWCAAVTKAGA